MKLIKIIGIGSPFGDDQIGWRVIDTLQFFLDKKTNANNILNIDLKKCQGHDLIQQLQHTEAVIIIDAIHSDTTKGTIHRFSEKDIENVTGVISSHGLNVVNAIQLLQVLGVAPKEIYFFGIEIGDENTIQNNTQNNLEDISAELENVVDNVANEILKLVKIY